jgi:hypothetical protein
MTAHDRIRLIDPLRKRLRETGASSTSSETSGERRKAAERKFTAFVPGSTALARARADPRAPEREVAPL